MKNFLNLIKKYTLQLLLTGFCLSNAGCAPGLGKTIDIDVPIMSNGTGDYSPGSRTEVSLQLFSDRRKNVFIGMINDRKLLPGGSVSLSVQKAFEQYLESKNIVARPGTSTVIQAEVLEWQVDVNSGFPTSKAEAKAKIKFVVSSPASPGGYIAEYNAAADREDPFMSAEDVTALLHEVLKGVFEAALDDGKFLAAIGSI